MTKVVITVEIESEHADDEDSTGLSSEAYDRLTDPMDPQALTWLGEVQEVKKVS